MVLQNMPQVAVLKTKVTWETGTRNRASIRDFPPVYIDEPAEMGGSNYGPNPMEYVLAALGGCTSIMINMIAAEMGFKLEGLDVRTEGKIDTRGLMGQPGISRHYQEVKEVITVRSGESRERFEELREKVIDRCPAINLFGDAGLTPEMTWRLKDPGRPSEVDEVYYDTSGKPGDGRGVKDETPSGVR